jgi:virginiamycin B lyase
MGPGGNLLEECAAGGSSSVPDGITVADNQIWFSLSGSNRIGRINPFAANVCGSFSQFPTSSPFPSGPGDNTSGHGQIRFTESNSHRVSSMTTSGTYSPGAALPAGGDPSGITTSGAYVWFTDAGNNQIGRIDPTVGSVNLFIPTGAGPSAITTGPDGALWFTETVANKIGRMTIGNSPTLTNEFAIPTANSQPGEIAVGQDNALWFTEFAANKIGRIATAPPFVAPPPPPPVTPAATKKCKVPKLKGLTVKKARTKLKKAGCKYKIRGKGKVRSTSPKAGATTTKTVVVKCKAKKRKAKRAVHRASVVATSLAAPATTHLRQDFADRPEADGLLHRHASKKPRRNNRRLRAPGGRGAYSGLARDGTRAAEAAEATSNTGRRTGKRALMRRLMTVRGGLQA